MFHDVSASDSTVSPVKARNKHRKVEQIPANLIEDNVPSNARNITTGNKKFVERVIKKKTSKALPNDKSLNTLTELAIHAGDL